MREKPRKGRYVINVIDSIYANLTRAQRARAAEIRKARELVRPKVHDIAVTFHAAVPREIRNHVYELLYPSMAEVLETGLIALSKLPHSIADIHWLFPKVVGPDFARECVEICYEKATLYFELVDILNVRKLLSTDSFEYGVIPLEHMRSCEVMFTQMADGYYPLKASDANSGEYIHELESLMHLKQAGSTQVDLVIGMCREPPFRRLYALVLHLDMLLPLVYRYKDKGLKCRVLVTTFKLEKPQKRRDITFLWDMTSQKLTKKVDEWGQTVDKFIVRRIR